MRTFAQTENGIGISFKLPDGTMVWARRDTWAELTEDVSQVLGEENLANLETALHKMWGPKDSYVTPEVSVATVARELGATAGETTNFETCPRCGAQKNKWVEPGFSKKTNKAYAGFFACPTQGCPGR